MSQGAAGRTSISSLLKAAVASEMSLPVVWREGGGGVMSAAPFRKMETWWHAGPELAPSPGPARPPSAGPSAELRPVQRVRCNEQRSMEQVGREKACGKGKEWAPTSKAGLACLLW